MILALKFIFSLGIVYWLYTSGKIDFSYIPQLSFDVVFYGFLLSILNLFLISLRLSILIKSSLKVIFSPLKIFPLNWIGSFFNSVLPGSVSGDFVKIYYIKRLAQNLSTGNLLTNIIIDRIFGLIGMVSLTGLSSCYILWGLKLENAAHLFRANILVFTIMVIVLLTVFLRPSIITTFLKVLSRLIPFKGLFHRLTEIWQNIVSVKRKLLVCIFLSFLVQVSSALMFFLLTREFYTVKLSLLEVMSIVPIGFMTLAIPISPGGLGVGHAAFQQLFQFLGEENGASFFNIYFFVWMCFNLLGLIPYAFFKEDKTIQK